MPWLASQPLAIKIVCSMCITAPTMTYISVPIMMKIIGPYVLRPAKSWNHAALNSFVIGITYLTMFEYGLIATGEIGYIQDILLKLL
jgi:hypothetical protein